MCSRMCEIAGLKQGRKPGEKELFSGQMFKSTGRRKAGLGPSLWTMKD